MTNSGQQVYLIAAVDEHSGIGKRGKLPWHFKREVKFFAKTTKTAQDSKKQNMVIMGRTTWEGLSGKYKPLPGRLNVILTAQNNYQTKTALLAHSLAEAFKLAESNDKIENIFVIGGSKVFQEAIIHPYIDGIYLTLVHKIYDCDTFFPKISEQFEKHTIASEKENDTKLDYFLYKKKPPGPKTGSPNFFLEKKFGK